MKHRWSYIADPYPSPCRRKLPSTNVASELVWQGRTWITKIYRLLGCFHCFWRNVYRWCIFCTLLSVAQVEPFLFLISFIFHEEDFADMRAEKCGGDLALCRLGMQHHVCSNVMRNPIVGVDWCRYSLWDGWRCWIIIDSKSAEMEVFARVRNVCWVDFRRSYSDRATRIGTKNSRKFR